LLGLAACVAREVPSPNVPRSLIATPGSATVPPEPPPSGCHLTAFGEPPTERETADALAKLANLEARAKTTFDVGGGKPALAGSAHDVFSIWPEIVAEAKELDEALRALRQAPTIAALALLGVGDIYDAMAAGLVAWRSTRSSLLSAAQLAKGKQMMSSQAGLGNLVADMESSLEERYLHELELVRANALTAYLGVLQLIVMSQSPDRMVLRTRAESRARDLFVVVADPRHATRPLQDPTSDSPTCLLDLVDPTR
jgi:hypothetical protein